MKEGEERRGEEGEEGEERVPRGHKVIFPVITGTLGLCLGQDGMSQTKRGIRKEGIFTRG